MKFSKLISILLILPFSCLLWLISCIAETNRTPFDFSEGESELVSGFNIEYGSGLFALIFIAEYGRIFFLRIISSSLITGIMFRSILTHVIIISLVFFWYDLALLYLGTDTTFLWGSLEKNFCRSL